MKTAVRLGELFTFLWIVGFFASVSGQSGVSFKVTKNIKSVNKMISMIQKHGLDWSKSVKQRVFKQATKVLNNLQAWQVWLILHRTGKRGAVYDKHISQIEEKTYQLKSMLIQLNQSGFVQ